jgi:hypothetical protein
MKMKTRITIIAILTSYLAWSSPAELIPSDRLATWQDNVGVPGGYEQYLPGGASQRTVLHDVTQEPYNADKTGATDASAAINSAIAGIPSGEVVYLPAGTYRISASAIKTTRSGITIRGAGVGQTILDARRADGIQVSVAGTFRPPTNVVSGLTGGSTSVVLDSSSGFAVGRGARIEWPNDPNKVWSVYGVPYSTRFDVIVTGISGNTVDFTPPLPNTSIGYGQARMKANSFSYIDRFGIEDLSVVGHVTSGHADMGTGITFSTSMRSWIKNIRITNAGAFGIKCIQTIRNTITKVWIDPAISTGTNHSGIISQQGSGLLWYDNILDRNGPAFEINFSTSGSVFAYNLILAEATTAAIDTNHGQGNRYNLYEGNVAIPGIISDSYFGSVGDDTIFRNWMSGVGVNSNTEKSALFLKRMVRDYSLVGNIIGKSGFAHTYDGIKDAGEPNPGNATSFGTAQPSLGNWWRDINPDGTTPYFGTLTTKTDPRHGVINLTSGTVDNLFGSARGDNYFAFYATSDTTKTTRYTVNFTAHTGDDITVNSATGYPDLPAARTTVEIWASPGGFQELDLDVAATLLKRVNYYYFTGDIPDAEALGADTFPNSLYLSGKPTWWPSCSTWPPFDPQNPGTPSYDKIPAGWRYNHSGADQTCGTPTPTPTGSPSATPTATATSTPSATPTSTP